MNTEITCFYKLLSYALHPDHSDMITQTQKEQIRQKLPDLLNAIIITICFFLQRRSLLY